MAEVAQRRPGREPRRHRCADRWFVIPGSKSAQRRPGREPRRHRPPPRRPRRRDADRSTKAGARTPATPGPVGSRSPCCPSAQRRPGREPRRHVQRRRGRQRRTSLNEGRGANPGDTHYYRFRFRLRFRAQRRPGREPRRHIGNDGESSEGCRRSTKAGARTPATPPPVRVTSESSESAQRRPGREPRRHCSNGIGC